MWGLQAVLLGSEIIWFLGKLSIKQEQAVSLIAVKDLQTVLWVHKCPLLYKQAP